MSVLNESMHVSFHPITAGPVSQSCLSLLCSFVFSQTHLPGFIEMAGDLRARGVGEIACVSVNDVFVMSAWGKQNGADGKVRKLSALSLTCFLLKHSLISLFKDLSIESLNG